MFRCLKTLQWRAAFMAACAVGISSSMAMAQENGVSPAAPPPDQVASSPEVVIVVHPGLRRSTIGAPIEDVSLSAGVDTRDLNLQSPADIVALRDRVWQTARRLCDRLTFRYPIGVPDEYRCTRNAVENTSDQIDAAIASRVGTAGIENP